MDGKERRHLLLAKLTAADEPLTGTVLAQMLGVSRQIVVGDIAIMRAAGSEIIATPQGYILPSGKHTRVSTVKIACRHDWQNLAEELAIIIDHGGKVVDVIVEHPVYGELRANLMLASRRDLAEFLRKLDDSGAAPLSIVTGGIHLHTIEVPSAAVLQEIEAALNKRGILYS